MQTARKRGSRPATGGEPHRSDDTDARPVRAAHPSPSPHRLDDVQHLHAVVAVGVVELGHLVVAGPDAEDARPLRLRHPEAHQRLVVSQGDGLQRQRPKTMSPSTPISPPRSSRVRSSRRKTTSPMVPRLHSVPARLPRPKPLSMHHSRPHTGCPSPLRQKAGALARGVQSQRRGRQGADNPMPRLRSSGHAARTRRRLQKQGACRMDDRSAKKLRHNELDDIDGRGIQPIPDSSAGRTRKHGGHGEMSPLRALRASAKPSISRRRGAARCGAPPPPPARAARPPRARRTAAPPAPRRTGCPARSRATRSAGRRRSTARRPA